MRKEIPQECFLNLSAEITPELAVSRAEKMKHLFRVQLLGKSVSSTDSALSLLVDLARDLVSYDKAVLLWREDPEGPEEVKICRGFGEAPMTADLARDNLCYSVAGVGTTVLVSAATCGASAANDLLERWGAASGVSVPIQVAEQLRGCLLLFRSGAPEIQREDAHLLRVYALTFEPLLDSLAPFGRSRDFVFLDGPTGLFNDLYFEQHLEREIDRARRSNAGVSLLLVELDQFEDLKAEEGFAAGDAVLQDAARRLRGVCRKSDTVARHGDGTFAVILPHTGKDTLPLVARRVFGALASPARSPTHGGEGRRLEINVSAACYPDDAFSVETLLAACHDGLEKARTSEGMRFFQSPAARPVADSDDILDAARMGLLREPLTEPSRFINLFARICLDTVPADRVSILLREGNSLVMQVALGFEGQDEIARTTRVPLSGNTISSWVAQRREPLLVRGAAELSGLPPRSQASYRSDSFISFPLVEGDELLGVIHFSNRADGNPFSQEDLDAFRPVARLIGRYVSQSRTFAQAQEDFLKNALFGLVDVIERQVPGMENHSAEVARLAEATARQMGYSGGDLERLRVSSLLHDLGKAGYRSSILAESRALSPRERTLAQRHPLLGWKFLESIPLDQVDRDAVLYHHEREDGSGYFGKQAADIPASAKILAVADVYQALVSPRPYRPAIERSEAVAYLEGQKGILFDAGVVDAFNAVVAASS